VDAFAALNASLDYGLSDEQLMNLDVTYVGPRPWSAGLKEGWPKDLDGLGVEFYGELYSLGGVTLGLGQASEQPDLTAYSAYRMSFTNLSTWEEDDSYNVNLYIKTGENETLYESGWSKLSPGKTKQLTLGLTSIPDLDDVTEIGFGLLAWSGTGWGYADRILLKIEPTVPEL
jgi:hypothetical protein